jgi:hypothetical protein
VQSNPQEGVEETLAELTALGSMADARSADVPEWLRH